MSPFFRLGLIDQIVFPELEGVELFEGAVCREMYYISARRHTLLKAKSNVSEKNKLDYSVTQ